jgi:tetratricopeptide (TPR) repeat protein
MSNGLPAHHGLILCLIATALCFAADAPDYSKESTVIENMTTKVKFLSDGTSEVQQRLAIRLQSEAAVRRFGVLSFSYSSESEQVAIEYIRVRKPDGSVIGTPASSVMDVATEVATAAPTYSDLRQKQIPVKALGVGDLLEYSVRVSTIKPKVPGQFWYEQGFVDDSVVLSQVLEVSVPKDKYVRVSSPKLKSETHDDGDQNVFVWKHAHLEPSTPKDKKMKAGIEDEPLKVQITTFRSWEEVGNWWGAMEAEQLKVTPAIQSKANDLTAGLSTDTEKAKAIYAYVAMKFRYISISLGDGRYRPHSAEEVLQNQYGDCKDKHTLFAALLKATGIQAWPALIGAGIKFDARVPSPGHFNHVITVLPRADGYVWLDTTSEVAPFSLLNPSIRDEEALVIPTASKPFLVKTPKDPPFAASEIIDVKSSLSTDGTLTGHFDFRLHGDNAVLLRSAFHQLAPAQWQTLGQQMSYGMGYAGDVSGIDVENVSEIEKPFHFSYDYERKKYSDWAERRITPPIPSIGFGPGVEAERPKEAIFAGAPGETVYRASIQIPKGYNVELNQDTTVTTDFANYSSRYSFKEGTIFTERKLVLKRSNVEVTEWQAYQDFIKGVQDDQTRYIVLVLSERPGEPKASVTETNPDAERLIQSAVSSLQNRDFNASRDLLVQAERLNPKQLGLWAAYGFLEASSGHYDKAIVAFRKEIQYHPENSQIAGSLSALLVLTGRSDEAIEFWQAEVARKPEDGPTAIQAVNLMMQAKRYAEIPLILEKPIAAAPNDYYLQVLRAQALLRGGQTDKGVEEVRRIAKIAANTVYFNDLAYALADSDSDLDLAFALSREGVAEIEQKSAEASLATLQNADLLRVYSLAADWDTLGWVYFKLGDLDKAEKYIDASWQLSQHGDVADHLGRVYEKQGKQDAAIKIWRLALASNNRQEDAQQRLRTAGAISEPDPKTVRAVSSAEELGKLRTFDIPALPKQTGSAEMFLLISKRGIEDVQFISGSDALKKAGTAIQSSGYTFPFPNGGSAKIIRRGILSCSAYTTPSCQMTLLLPSTVHVGNAPN